MCLLGGHILTKNLTKKIGKNLVLDNISIKMEAGKVYGFQGINGSGKTMLMRSILGLIKATEGEILIDNKNGYSGYDNLKFIGSLEGEIDSDEIVKLNAGRIVE